MALDANDPPGIHYFPATDIMVLKLYVGDDFPVPMRPLQIKRPLLGLVLDVHEGKQDGRLYAVAVRDASKHVPAAVLSGAAGGVLDLVEPADEAGSMLLPLVPHAVMTATTRLQLTLPGREAPFDLVLDRTSHVVGFLVKDAASRLPAAVTGS